MGMHMDMATRMCCVHPSFRLAHAGGMVRGGFRRTQGVHGRGAGLWM